MPDIVDPKVADAEPALAFPSSLPFSRCAAPAGAGRWHSPLGASVPFSTCVADPCQSVRETRYLRQGRRDNLQGPSTGVNSEQVIPRLSPPQEREAAVEERIRAHHV